MRGFIFRLLSLFFGLSLFALGIVIKIKANIGYSPWDVFHVGLSVTAGISIGFASILTGIVIIIFVTLAGEKIGIGTVSNILVIGLLVDLYMFLDFIPLSSNFVVGIAMMLSGLLIMSFGSFLYIRSAFGVGPRDNLMVVLKRKTKLPVGVCRSIVELTATVSGWFLGGMVGIGTIISVVAVGFFIQMTFAIFKFKPTEVKHETILETFRNLRDIKNKTPPTTEGE